MADKDISNRAAEHEGATAGGAAPETKSGDRHSPKPAKTREHDDSTHHHHHHDDHDHETEHHG